MKRERDLQVRLRSLQMLGQAVAAMKSLSSHHFRAAREALAPARTYREGVDTILRSTGASLPAGDGPTGLVVIGGELGFCGSYNAQVAEAAQRYVADHGEGPVLCVGHRVATYLRRMEVPIHRVYSGPTSIQGITDTLMAVTQDIFDDYFRLRLAGIDVIANRFVGVGAFSPEVVSLLPVEAEPIPGAPKARYVGHEHLVSVVVRELLYIEMVELLLGALASEHGARLVATQSAEHWLDDRIEHLTRQLSSARREASTQEVIEISAGTRRATARG